MMNLRLVWSADISCGGGGSEGGADMGAAESEPSSDSSSSCSGCISSGWVRSLKAGGSEVRRSENILDSREPGPGLEEAISAPAASPGMEDGSPAEDAEVSWSPASSTSATPGSEAGPHPLVSAAVLGAVSGGGSLPGVSSLSEDDLLFLAHVLVSRILSPRVRVLRKLRRPPSSLLKQTEELVKRSKQASTTVRTLWIRETAEYSA